MIERYMVLASGIMSIWGKMYVLSIDGSWDSWEDPHNTNLTLMERKMPYWGRNTSKSHCI